MKRLNKKFCAVLLAVILACCSMSGCLTSPDTRSVYTINGREFPVGLFLMYQLNAYELIASYMNSTFSQTDPATGTFYDMETQMQWTVSPPYGDGETVAAWIANKALDDMKLGVYFESAMEECGLTVSESDRAEADQLAEYLYSSGEQEYDKYYTRNGISLSSLRTWLYDRYNQQTVFTYFYGKGGEREVSDEELKAAFLEDYAYMKVVQIPYYNIKTGQQLSTEEIGAIETYIKDSIALINKGEMTLDDMQREILASDGELTAEEADTVAQSQFINLSESSYTGNMVDTYQKLSMGEVGYDKDPNYGFYFVFQKLDPLADGLTYFEDSRSDVLSSLKGTDFLTECLEKTDAYAVEYDQSAAKKYEPIHIKPELTSSST